MSRKLSSEVCLDQVGKRYGERWAVREVSLTVLPGEFFALIGPTGGGKTTLLRLVAGLEFPDSGRILLDGEPIHRLPPWKRNVGLVFQGGALWPHLGVFDNVAFGLRERGLSREQVAGRVAAALRGLALEGLEHRRPGDLSLAARQRVALARALVVEPRALLLDEPLTALDPPVREEMRLELARLHRDLGITTVYATQERADAFALSHRVAVVVGGAVIQQGPPEEVYWHPRSRAVALAMGPANLLPVRVVELRETGVVVDAGVGLHVPVSADPARWRTGDRALLCLRPEALRLDEAPLGRGTGFPATVAARVFEGARHVYEVRLGERIPLRIEMAALGEGRIFRLGDRVRVELSPETAVLLAET